MTRLICRLAPVAALVGLAMSTPASGRQDSKSETKDDKKVVTTATGLKYIDEKVGEGRAAKVGDTVEVHYTGTFKDGKVFDSSKGKKPLEFKVGYSEVIKGWHEGIVGVKVGGKRKLMIPYILAYGEAGRPGIPPKTDLNFDIELVRIK